MTEKELSPDEQLASDVKKSKELVHARYVGDTEVVFPHAEGSRCCRPENVEGHEEQPALVKKGDVILVDRYSAEGREDLELVKDEAPKAPKRK